MDIFHHQKQAKKGHFFIKIHLIIKKLYRDELVIKSEVIGGKKL